jgi:hypothetical protein
MPGLVIAYLHADLMPSKMMCEFKLMSRARDAFPPVTQNNHQLSIHPIYKKAVQITRIAFFV